MQTSAQPNAGSVTPPDITRLAPTLPADWHHAGECEGGNLTFHRIRAPDASQKHRYNAIWGKGAENFSERADLYYVDLWRQDMLGRVWSRSFCAVMDDFGDLVEVAP